MKMTLFVLMVAVYGIQLWHTYTNQINWPFSSHNFYYHRSPLVKDVFRIVLIDDAGNSHTVDPKNTLPVEGYRTGSIIREIYQNNQDHTKKDQFSKQILSRLNQGGWRRFDERSNSVLPKQGHRFTGLIVEKHVIDTREYPLTQQLPVLKKDTLYHFDEG
jgi:hypothetical protein